MTMKLKKNATDYTCFMFRPMDDFMPAGTYQVDLSKWKTFFRVYT